MTNEAIEAAARAMCAEQGSDPDKLTPHGPNWMAWVNEARAAAPALMAEGARLALEAAAKLMNVKSVRCESKNVNFAMRCAKEIRALDPAAIVKGAGHDRD